MATTITKPIFAVTFSKILSTLIISIPYSHSRKQSENKEWFQNICRGKEKLAKVHFFVQDVLTGPNQTVFEVAESNISATSPSGFGVIRVSDDKMTAGPEQNSTEVGRAQGLVTTSDLRVLTLSMNINFYFIRGKYNGSTLSILGRNPVLEKHRELPVVGGTGKFRFARGYASLTTYFSQNVTSYSALEFTIYTTYVDDDDEYENAHNVVGQEGVLYEDMQEPWK